MGSWLQHIICLPHHCDCCYMHYFVALSLFCTRCLKERCVRETCIHLISSVEGYLTFRFLRSRWRGVQRFLEPQVEGYQAFSCTPVWRGVQRFLPTNPGDDALSNLRQQLKRYS